MGRMKEKSLYGEKEEPQRIAGYFHADRRILEDLGMWVPTMDGPCPNGCSSSCSVTPKRDKILWYCHRCGVGGSPIDAYMHHHELEFPAAMTELKRRYGIGYVPTPPSIVPERRQVKLEPTDREVPPIDEIYVNGRPRTTLYSRSLHTATFRDVAPALVDGKLRAMGVVRFDTGRKKQISQCHYDGTKWVSKALRVEPRPIYRMFDISVAPPEKLVVIVEGEKCMHAAQAALPDAIVTTSVGGCKAVRLAHWECLQGTTNIVVIPDIGSPDYAAHIQHRLPQARVFNLTGANGYDIADWLKDNNGLELAEMLSNGEKNGSL